MTKYYKPLIEYRRWLKNQSLLVKIKQLKEKGMNNTNIGNELGISSVEVSVILNNSNNNPDFFAPYNR